MKKKTYYEIEGEQFELSIFHQKRKQFKITLSEANRLQVFMPRYVAIERLYAFLDTKKQWIIKHNKKLRQAILLPELSKEEEIIRRDALRAEAQAF